MQVSKQRVNKTIQSQIDEIFCQLVSDIKSPQEAQTIFKDLLSQTELQALVKRLAIVIFLDKGRSYGNIKHILKVSSATIATVNEQMGNPGVQLALRKVKADAWADEWTGKITSLVGKLLPSK